MAVRGSTAFSGEGEAERQFLEGELHDAECTLLGEVQQIERLAQENNSKVEELRGLKDDVRTLQERNEYHVSMLQDEHASAQQELAHRLAVLREQAKQLGLKHERYKETVRLNEAAGAEVESLLLKMEQRTKTHGEDVHATRQEMLHLRQELESTFRKTLKDLGGTYRRKAFKALGSSAKEGMRANKLLREEMALQQVGVAALSERYSVESKRAIEFMGELKGLRHSKLGHQNSLADLQRTARANAMLLSDIQETKTRISEARESLQKELDKHGIPGGSLGEIHDMALKEREEARRLEKLKLQWQRRTKEVIRAIFPSSSGAKGVRSAASATGAESTCSFGSFGSSTYQTSSSDLASTTTCTDSASVGDASSCRHRALRGSTSAPPGLEAFLVPGDVSISKRLTATGGMSKRQDAETAWQARVERVTNRWTKDRADVACFARVGGGGRQRDQNRNRDQNPDHPCDESARALQLRPSQGLAPAQAYEMKRLKGKRSASSSALDGVVLSPSSSSPRPTPAANPAGTSRPFGTLTGSASTGGLGLRFWIGEENPWERKHRMERAIRRRDASIRAKGLAVNSSRACI